MNATRAHEYDAVVVGAGPNGLVAAATLAGEGWRVLVLEAGTAPGGGTRSAELTLPGYVHDVCSAVHPLALASPALTGLGLERHGVDWVHPPTPLAHPLDGGRAVMLERSVEATAAGLGTDGLAYRRLAGALAGAAEALAAAVLSPLTRPPMGDLGDLARFGLRAGWPARGLARRAFRTEEARALLAGLSGHSMLSLRAPGTAGFGLFLGMLGHRWGWPVARGGSQSIADALASIVAERGGEIVTGQRVRSLAELPPARATLLDVTPRQVLALDDGRLPHAYRRGLGRYRYGPGVWKVDWALDGPIPWTATACTRAATVHLGGTLDEITAAEDDVAHGRHPERPYVLLSQPSVFDPSRALTGRHTAWAYCHVPNGSTLDMTERIEAQVERFAPGFRDRVIGHHTVGPAALEAHNANYVGGDIAGGHTGLIQLLARPVASRSPWRTPVAGLYLCSSSTPPGAGVHGMCGWHAATAALADHGNLDHPNLGP